MKRILAIYKDLHDSGQHATIIGHFSIQTGNFQEVTNANNVHEQPKTALYETNAGKNSNRTTTEHDRDDVSVCNAVSTTVELTPDLLEVIGIWKNLSESVQTGIIMIATSVETAD